jgi:hypothetical protein
MTINKEYTYSIGYSLLIDFLAYATTNDKPITLSSKHNAGLALDLLNDFVNKHSLFGNGSPEYLEYALDTFKEPKLQDK